jgi:hypothetical protein
VDCGADLPDLPAGSGENIFLEDKPLDCVLLLLLGEMLNVSSYGPHGGKLSLLCQGSYEPEQSKI